jgi:hypothetical protein
LIQNKIAQICYENHQKSIKEAAAIVEENQKVLSTQILTEKKKSSKLAMFLNA